MFTKIVYFRPDRKYVKEELLTKHFSCMIKDEFMSTENLITAPVYLTIFQHYLSKSKKRLTSKKQDFLHKICFYLVGSNQAPSIRQYSEFVDRIEFHGHIGFEKPVFEVIQNLRKLRKVGFFLSICKQENFVQETSRVAGTVEEDNSNESKQSFVLNNSITSLKIVMEKCGLPACSCCNLDEFEGLGLDRQKLYGKLSVTRKETLRVMIIRLLRATVQRCPNLKRISIDVPNWKGLKKVVDETIDMCQFLKDMSTTVSNGQIFVRKTEKEDDDDDAVTVIALDQAVDDLKQSSTVNGNGVQTTSSNDVSVEQKNANNENQSVIIKVEIGQIEDGTLELEEVTSDEPASNLVDMSKLLGSMLGIPTSLGGPSASSQSVPFLNSSSNQVTNANNTVMPQLTKEQKNNLVLPQPVSNHNHSSTSVSYQKRNSLPTYAAAAASATTNHTRRVSCTANGSHKIHTNISTTTTSHRNEDSSKRTFLRDKEEVINKEEPNQSNGNNKKPSNTHVADLGKPVLVNKIIPTNPISLNVIKNTI